MFNEVRVFLGQPVRLWSVDRGGRFAIFPNGIMRWFDNGRINSMPSANPDQIAGAFPPQDQGDRM
jgi:hypothetical protein